MRDIDTRTPAQKFKAIRRRPPITKEMEVESMFRCAARVPAKSLTIKKFNYPIFYVGQQ